MNEADTCRKFVVPLLQAAGDTLHFFDNSSDTPRLIFKDEAGQTTINDGALYEQLRSGGCIMKKPKQSSLTQKALQALTHAVAKAVEDHRRRGIPLAVWRNGAAVSIPAEEAAALQETPI